MKLLYVVKTQVIKSDFENDFENHLILAWFCFKQLFCGDFDFQNHKVG